MHENQWYVYIVEASDGSLYTGITTDVSRRIRQHNQGIGAKSLRGIRPVTLRYVEPVSDRSRALKREANIKTWKRTQKLSLMQTPVHDSAG